MLWLVGIWRGWGVLLKRSFGGWFFISYVDEFEQSIERGLFDITARKRFLGIGFWANLFIFIFRKNRTFHFYTCAVGQFLRKKVSCQGIREDLLCSIEGQRDKETILLLFSRNHEHHCLYGVHYKIRYMKTKAPPWDETDLKGKYGRLDLLWLMVLM